MTSAFKLAMYRRCMPLRSLTYSKRERKQRHREFNGCTVSAIKNKGSWNGNPQRGGLRSVTGRGRAGTSATQVQHRCNTSSAQMQHKGNTIETQVQLKM